MNAPNLHLLLSHFPIVLAVIGTLAALLAFGVQKRSMWVFAAASLTIAGATIYPALWTGQRSAGVVAGRWYASPDAIRQHEEAAVLATWITLIAGLVAAYSWYRAGRRPRHRDDRFPAPLQLLLAVTGLCASGALLYASWQSGSIVHKAASPPEIAPDVRAQPAIVPAAPAPPGRGRTP